MSLFNNHRICNIQKRDRVPIFYYKTDIPKNYFLKKQSHLLSGETPECRKISVSTRTRYSLRRTRQRRVQKRDRVPNFTTKLISPKTTF